MKKRDVLNLIRYYSEHNDAAFRNEAYNIAKDFDHSGDSQLAEYIIALLSGTNTFVPQSTESDVHSGFLNKLPVVKTSLPLPTAIAQDIQGLINAIGRNVGIHRFLFHGPAGTGKTESVKQISSILQRELYVVDFSAMIDSRLGQTAKNITSLFAEINSFTQPDRTVILFDEIDALALDRVDSHDVREMGRATSTLLTQMDNLPENIVLFATTNLFSKFDKAFIRRFDAVIDFGRYTKSDLSDVATNIMNDYAGQFSFIGKNIRLFKKIMNLAPKLPYPGEMKNIIRSSIAFSKPGDEFDYLRRIYTSLIPNGNAVLTDPQKLRAQGFTVREVETLTGIPRSTVSRETKRGKNE
ncbi:ATP-binding protein [Bifidobacterium sp. ESL0728]|uniref:ATP-binding protein n=1 Tax=Bifidobacterium sp. ESL0728 TaxID=2983220 RepID=UPI0023F96AEC|nr:ATP-binding protein [Bifidobacterium sp. ESL0728]WEV59160.1 ATP-binding protein [Bifidobacterium sp. ESL0728]